MLPNHALEGGGQCQMLHPSRLPRGSARLRFPAKTEHALKCAELSECVFALISPGPFAIKTVPTR
jgi:hypothetical protein